MPALVAKKSSRLIVLWISIASVIGALVIVELALRLFPGWQGEVIETKAQATYYLRQMMKDPVLRANYFAGSCGVTYRDYYYYSWNCKSEKLNTSSYFDARATPDSDTQGDTPIVWMFGGSTMLNLTASDDLTIANQVAVLAKSSGRTLNVRNFGAGGFASSQELIKFVDLLRRVPAQERPRVAIFYDGFNDSAQSATFGPGNLQEDLNGKIRSLIENQGSELGPSYISAWLSQKSKLWEVFLAPKVQQAYFNTLVARRPAPSTDPGPSVDVYEHNLEILRALGKAFGIEMVFVLQPLIYTKTPLSEMEQDVMKFVADANKPHADFMRKWYSLAQSRFCSNEDFLDLSAVLNGRQFDDFADQGHTAPETGVVIAKPIADLVVTRLGAVQRNR